MMPNMPNMNGMYGNPYRGVGQQEGGDMAGHEMGGHQQAQQSQVAYGVPYYQGMNMYHPAMGMAMQPPPQMMPMYYPQGMNMVAQQMQSLQIPEQSADTKKRKNTSQWALEQRRARNRVTAAESRLRAKEDMKFLSEQVDRMSAELEAKTTILENYRKRIDLYEKGEDKEAIFAQLGLLVTDLEEVKRAKEIRMAEMQAMQTVVKKTSESGEDVDIDGGDDDEGDSEQEDEGGSEQAPTSSNTEQAEQTILPEPHKEQEA